MEDGHREMKEKGEGFDLRILRGGRSPLGIVWEGLSLILTWLCGFHKYYTVVLVGFQLVSYVQKVI